jgi:hypothetical protein
MPFENIKEGHIKDWKGLSCRWRKSDDADSSLGEKTDNITALVMRLEQLPVNNMAISSTKFRVDIWLQIRLQDQLRSKSNTVLLELISYPDKI